MRTAGPIAWTAEHRRYEAVGDAGVPIFRAMKWRAVRSDGSLCLVVTGRIWRWRIWLACIEITPLATQTVTSTAQPKR